jgi:thymidylate synthase
MYQRSKDEACGTSFNIASYSFLTHLLAKHCGLEPYEFIYFGGNCHIYEEHLDSIKTILDRRPFEFPTIEITNLKENINEYEISDFVVSNYNCHDVIKMKMVV